MIKTVSLETAKKLKEAGFRHGTYLCWTTWSEYASMGIGTDLGPYYRMQGYQDFILDWVSAPTTDELLEELPYRITRENYIAELWIHKNSSDYVVCYTGQPHTDNKYFENESLPEALASMWIYLKQQDLLKGG